MPSPHDLCARLQNGFRAHLRQIAIPHTTQNLAISSILLRHGFLSNVTRGTTHSPSPSEWQEVKEPQRRIWLDLKYRDNSPVLSTAELISKPSKKIFMGVDDIHRICSGRSSQFVKPLGLGEIAIVKTEKSNHEYVEARDALRLGLEGEVLCRMR